jgi:glyoxylase-like metal-dependent hydrolase (beta-lactamase superfamily II)
MPNALPDTISAIDGHYQFDGRAAAYLLQEGDEAAFIDNITRFSVPSLLDALKQRGLTPEQVKYAIVTHIHLDHSGGTAELVNQCPNATVLCHPRAARHIIDPSRLVASARPIYGEVAFDELYGEIEPVNEARVRIVEDSETVTLGNRTLTFWDTPGHARHHHSIHDSRTNTIFSGDAFGTAYRQLQGGTAPFMNYVCAPPEFDPQAAIGSIEKLAGFGAERVMVTHFGEVPDIQAGADQQIQAILKFEQLAKDVAATDLDGDVLEDYCVKRCREIIENELKRCGLDPNDADIHKWSTTELNITSQGIAVLAGRIRSGKY